MDIFEQASRAQLRIPSNKGNLTVEDLWTLPITTKVTTKVSLTELITSVAESVDTKSFETLAFLTGTAEADPRVQLTFDILKHIIQTKQAEAINKSTAKARETEIAELDALIRNKQNEAKASLSVEELITLRQGLEA